MDSLPRHQCLIYEGSPSKHLAGLATLIRGKLRQNYRCLYFDNRPMIAGLRSCLAAQGTNVPNEIANGNLILSSEQAHLVEGRFDIGQMMKLLRESLAEARKDEYAGLWASGDMSWELGPEKDFGQLLEYEAQLDRFVQENPEFGGICQYHVGTLPREILRQALVAHPTIVINEELSLINPHYLTRESMEDGIANDPEIEAALSQLLEQTSTA